MPPTTLPHHSTPAPHGDSRRLATSAFSGETRLRELEHLAETARRVRDQATAELARQGSAHHIARDRIAAAERMLQKAEKEIAELQAKLATAPQPAAKPDAATSSQDFELAVMLGHSKARFNRGAQAAGGFQLEQDKCGPTHRPAAARPNAGAGKAAPARLANARSAPPAGHSRRLVFVVSAMLAVGLVALVTYLLLGAGSAPQAINQTIEKIRHAPPGLTGQ